MSKIVEIRSYNLRAGTRDRFHDLFVSRALPVLRRHKIDVVAHGPSLHDDRAYFLIRAFGSLEQRTPDDVLCGAFSPDVESSTTIVVRVDDDTFEAFASLVTGRPYVWRQRKV